MSISTMSYQIQHAFRIFRRHPLLSAIIVVTLAVGIGANAAIFSVVHSLYHQPMPFEEPDQVVYVLAHQPEQGIPRAYLSQPDFRDWRDERVEALEGLAAVSNTRALTLEADDRPQHVTAEFVSTNFFQLLGLDPETGRMFSAADEAEAQDVVVLSYALWQSRFGGDSGVVGRKILLNDHPYQVIGVVARGFRGTWWDPIDLWLPMEASRRVLGDRYLDSRDLHWTLAMGRLKPGRGMEEARQELDLVAQRLEKAYPETNEGFRALVLSLPEYYFSHLENRLFNARMGALMVLLLCAVNVAALLLTRGASRRHEMAVRLALGSGRRTLVRQLLSESFVLGLAGGALGLLLARLATGPLLAISDIRPATFTGRLFDAELVLQVLGLSLLTALMVGGATVFQAFYIDLARTLRQGQTLERRRGVGRRVLGALTTVEVALALVVLIFAGLRLESFLNLRNGDPGYHTDDLLTVKLELRSPRFTEPASTGVFVQSLLERVEALPGVEAAGLVGPHPPPGANLYMDATIEDRLVESEDAATLRVYRQYISPGYLRAMGISMQEGREFDFRDAEQAEPVAVVSRSLAEVAWPGQNPLGKRLRPGRVITEEPWVTVIGVATTVKNRGIAFDPSRDLDVYLPILQDPQRITSLMMHMKGEVNGAFGEVQKLVQEIDPDAPVYDAATMRERLAYLAADEYFVSVVLSLFALVALFVAGIGISGMLAYGVRRRTREIGLRMALGASPGQVQRMILVTGLVRIGVGALLGLLAFYGLTRWMVFDLFEVSALDPRILTASVVLLVVTAAVAAWIPARKATAIQPTVALRSESTRF